jgi:hypothetical protein
MEKDDFQSLNKNINIDLVNEGKSSVLLSNADKTFSAFYNPAQVIYNNPGI